MYVLFVPPHYYCHYQILGISFLAGMAIVVVGLIINGVVFWFISKYRKRQIILTEARLRRFHDMLRGIKALKCVIWERSGEKFCLKPRRKEIRICSIVLVLESLQISVFLLSAPLAILVSFAVYTSRNLELSPSVIFSSLSLIIALRVPLIAFPASAAAYIQACIADDRISRYLHAPERRSFSSKYSLSMQVQIPLARKLSTHWKEEFGGKRDNVNRHIYGHHNEVVVSFQRCTLSWRKNSSRHPSNVFGRRNSFCSIEVNLGSESAPDDLDLYTLSDINISIRRGELIVVTGNIGSGKTALINAILGEMHVIDGLRSVNDQCALVPQTAWNYDGTVRENICMGTYIGGEKYEKIIWSVDLHHDFAGWPEGDTSSMSSIRDKMSGGQKTRINIARAAYSTSSIVLIDDCLTGLDASVLRKVFTRCINGLMKKKTRILVSRDPYILKMADRVVMMDNGRLIELGSGRKMSALLFRSGENAMDTLSKLFDSGSKQELEHQEEVVFCNSGRLMSDRTFTVRKRTPVNNNNSGNKEPSALETLTVRAHPLSTWRHHVFASDSGELSDEENGQLSPADFISLPSCRTSWATYGQYFSSGGYVEWFFAFFLIFAAQISNSLAEYILSRWSQSQIDQGTPDGNAGSLFGLYGGIVAIYSICLLLASGIQAIVGLRVASELYGKLLRSIMYTKMAFFDCISIGHLMSIFHRDIDVIDNILVPTWNIWIITVGSIFGAGIVTAISIPYLAIVFVCFVLLSIVLILWHRNSLAPFIDKEIQTRILMFTAMFQSVKRIGVVMHRSYAFTEIYERRVEILVNKYSRRMLDITILNSWLGVILEILGILFVTVSCALAVALHEDVGPARVAVVLTNAWLISSIMSASAEIFLQLDQKMQSVSRVLHFMSMPEEEHFAPKQMSSLSQYFKDVPYIFDVSRFYKPHEWPLKGELEITNLSFKYGKELPDILRHVNVKIKPRTFVSVVGRTGSGKSSLSSVLLGFAQQQSGTIMIDGVETNRVGLHSLRQVIGYLPQDPWIFSSGTLRQQLNLDNRHSDERIIEVLRQVGFTIDEEDDPASKDYDETDFNNWSSRRDKTSKANYIMSVLDCNVDGLMSERFTTGQQQLLCLARLILHDPVIYILDEATAHVDSRSEERILAAVNSILSQNRTVIWIAHKLTTVLDSSDYIYVMDGGKIIEEGKPNDLLDDCQSTLHRLVRPDRSESINAKKKRDHEDSGMKHDDRLVENSSLINMDFRAYRNSYSNLKRSLSCPDFSNSIDLLIESHGAQGKDATTEYEAEKERTLHMRRAYSEYRVSL